LMPASFPVVLPTIILTPSEVPGAPLCLTTVAGGRLLTATATVTSKYFWKQGDGRRTPALGVQYAPGSPRGSPRQQGVRVRISDEPVSPLPANPPWDAGIVAGFASRTGVTSPAHDGVHTVFLKCMVNAS